MRENYTWATDCGPVVGEIKNGKRYPNGAVPAEDYAKDMAAVSENINAVKEAISALNGAEVALETKVDALAQNYNGTVPGLQADTTALKVSLAELKTSIASLSSEVTSNANKEISDIEAVMERIAEVTAGVNSLADLVHEHSEAIAANTATVANHSSSISSILSSINSINSAITNVSNDLAQAKINLGAQIGTLSGRVDGIDTTVTNLTATVNAANAQMNARIAEVSNANKENEKDIAALKTVATNLSAGIDEANENIKSIGTRMTTLEVAMATLRNQQLNSVEQLTDSISNVANDVNVARTAISDVNKSLNDFETGTEAAIAVLSKRIDDLEGGQAIEILSFTATPTICEKGGSENVVLSWVINGSPKNITINGELFTGQGSEKTIKNVTSDTRFTLTATSEKGISVSRSVDVVFVNHVFWGLASSAQMNEGVVKGLENTDLTDIRTRTFRVSPENEYVVYAYPKRLGTSIFRSGGFDGGFNNPVTVSMDNHSGFEEDYYVYRSENELNIPVEINVL